MAGYIDPAIMFLAGVYATGVGFGWLASPARGPSAHTWWNSYGRLLKIFGPLLLVTSVLLAFAEFLMSA